MGATVETLPQRSLGARASQLKRPIALKFKDTRLLVEPDGAVRSFESLSERRSLFGYEQVWIYKTQAGVVVQAQRPDWAFRVTPRSAQLLGRVLDSVEVMQSIEFFSGPS
ncbi:MAG TPA: hypothetical protein VEB67_01475, partial [Nitrososphaerales archaeon]|nr:hypothetical protein [Nitrososphaerales archaeon]